MRLDSRPSSFLLFRRGFPSPGSVGLVPSWSRFSDPCSFFSRRGPLKAASTQMGRWGLAATRSAPDTHSHDRPPQPRSSTPPFFSLPDGFTVTGLGRDGPPLSASMELAMKAQGGASPGLPSGFHRPTNEPRGCRD